jgi:hypothetical protein
MAWSDLPSQAASTRRGYKLSKGIATCEAIGADRAGLFDAPSHEIRLHATPKNQIDKYHIPSQL